MTNEPNVSIPSLVKYLMRRAKHPDWSVVFKSVITMHYLISYGNERFIQNLASSLVNLRAIDRLANFNDTSSTQAYDMSTYLRRYARYLSARVSSYRALGLDFCRMRKTESSGLQIKTIPADQLASTLGQLQSQLDALLAFDVSPGELKNGVISSAFSLLYKDFVKLYITYQTAIIRLLELYFTLNNVKRLQELLDAYKKFLVRMDKVCDLMRVVEQVGMDKSDLPNVSRWPENLPPALLERWLSQIQRGSTTTNRPKMSPGRRSLSSCEPVPRLENPYASLGYSKRRSTRRSRASSPISVITDSAHPTVRPSDADKKYCDTERASLLPDLIELDSAERTDAGWVRID